MMKWLFYVLVSWLILSGLQLRMLSFPHVLLWILILCLALWYLENLILRFLEYLERRSNSRGGFLDWVMNPDYRQASEAYFEARRNLKVPENISDEEIRQMVERLFEKEDRDFNFDRLKLVGKKASPLLIEALSDPRTATLKFPDTGGMPYMQSPFARICELLSLTDTQEAAESVLPFASHEDSDFRKAALDLLGQIGNAEHLPALTLGLNDDDEYTCSATLRGISNGLQKDRPGREQERQQYVDALFPAITELLLHAGYDIPHEAAQLLLKMDADRALPILLSEKYCAATGRYSGQILRAMNETGHKVPHEFLLPFLKDVQPLAEKYPHNHSYREALIAYANHPDENAESLLQETLNSPDENLRLAAAQGISLMSGLPSDLWHQIVDRVFQDGNGKQNLKRLPATVVNYYVVQVYDSEIGNGGHIQYFANSSGDDWPTALAALKELELTQPAACLQAAVDLFGPAGPALDRDKRSTQLSRLISQKKKALDALDERYYQVNQDVGKTLSLYAAKHWQDFLTNQESP